MKDMTFFQALHRTIAVLFWVIVALIIMRLMAWSDTDMYGDGSKIETSIIPKEWRTKTK